MTAKEAEGVVLEWIQRERRERIRSMAQTGPKPTVHRVVLSPVGGVVPTTVKGSLGARAAEVLGSKADPAKFLFFVDRVPGANWEHPCQYVVVHPSKRLTVIDETAPPLPHEKAKLVRVKRLFPHDESAGGTGLRAGFGRARNPRRLGNTD